MHGENLTDGCLTRTFQGRLGMEVYPHSGECSYSPTNALAIGMTHENGGLTFR